MSHPHLFPPTERDTVQASFLEYVDLALSGAEIVANSQTTLNGFLSLNEKLNPDRSVTARVLYPPLRPLAAISSHARAEVSQVRANPEEIRLLGVGALNARKNFAVAIKALLILLEMNHSVKLSLVGGGHRHVHGEIQDLLRKFPRKYHSALTIFPAVSDEELENHYLDADIVLVPSKAEGFGLPILEAAVRLRPVIASDAEVFREIGQGLDVSFANEDNPEEWANRVISIAKRKTQEIPSQNSFDRFPATAQEFAHQLLTKK
jgi:glycosyltransferase involved in cell wall biosynthesis